MKSEYELLISSLKDFFSKDILKLAILPFVISSIVIYILFFSIATVGLEHFDQVVIEESSILYSDSNTISSSITSFLFKSSAIVWMVNFLVYSIGSIVMVYVTVFISLIVIGFLTPLILSKIRDKHYPNIIFNGNLTIISTIYTLIKYISIMLLLFIVLIPFYFIPFVNIIAINLPFYYLFHKLLNFDVSSTILEKDDIEYFKFKNKKEFRLRTSLLYLLSLIPFMSLILPVFYIVYVGHGYLNSLNNID